MTRYAVSLEVSSCTYFVVVEVEAGSEEEARRKGLARRGEIVFEEIEEGPARVAEVKEVAHAD